MYVCMYVYACYVASVLSNSFWLCGLMDFSLPGSSVHEDFPSKNNIWIAMSSSSIYIYTVVVRSPSHVQLFATPWLQHARRPCLSPYPRVCPSSCPLHPWSHPGISSSDVLFSFCPQCFPASGTSPVSWLFASGGQSIGASASTSAFPMRLTSFKINWLDLLAVQGTLDILLQLEFKGINSLALCLLYDPTLRTVGDHWENHSLDYTDLCWQSVYTYINIYTYSTYNMTYTYLKTYKFLPSQKIYGILVLLVWLSMNRMLGF